MVDYKKSLLKEKKVFYDTLKGKIDNAKLSHYGLFKKAISKPGQINLIAEIKKASPSKGLLRESFDVQALAKVYVEHGAAAISVLTEDKFFLGKPEHLKIVSDHFTVPVLRKDFIIDEVEIYDAFRLRASAVLLIVAILKEEQLKHLLGVAAQLDLDCLVEVHDEQELEIALKNGAEIIGINNRNLHTFEVDLQVAEKIIPQIPGEKVIVAESGISTHEEIVRLKALGAHAVLIGETFLKADDVGQKINEIMLGGV